MGYEKVSKKEMIKIRKEFCDDLGDFDRRFFDNLDLLIDRINKLKTLKPGTIDYWTYYDMVLTQIRAMLIETTGRKRNHTFQNYLKRMGQTYVAKEIDELFDKELIKGVTLREGIKVSVDKFIAHHDKVSDEDIRVELECRKVLTCPNGNKNIGDVFGYLMQLLLKGTLKAWGKHYTN